MVCALSHEFFENVLTSLIETLTWSRPNTQGKAPISRVGHTCTYIPSLYSVSSPGQRIQDSLLVLGGGDGENHLNDIHILELSTLTWKTLYTAGNTPSPRSRHTATLVENQLFVIGGGNDESTVFNDVYILDINTGQWTKPNIKGSPPIPRWGHSSISVGFHIYIFGGNDGKRMLNDVNILNTETLTWVLPPVIKYGDVIPLPRAGHASTVFNHGSSQYLCVFGGGNGEKIYNDTYIYDIENGNWIRPPIKGVLPSTRCGHTCDYIDGKVYVFGGTNGTKFYDDLYTIDVGMF